MSISPSFPSYPPPSSSTAGPSARHSHSISSSRGGFIPTTIALSPPSPPSSPSHSVLSSGDESISFLKKRPASVYTLSRPSLAEKVAELAAIPEPDRPSLSNPISSFQSATAAAVALFNFAEGIKKWVDRAGSALRSLDADGDVSWATASGRDGLEEVDGAISRFSGMINLYVATVEELQNRPDVGSVDPSYLTKLVHQVEVVVARWHDVKITLVHVKAQVEIALEWQELWDSVIGDIALEITALRRLIFQMEERRHRSTLGALADGGNAIDLGELETIVEEAPARTNSIQSISLGHGSGGGHNSLPSYSEESNLLALFARMQPLRASLDFLPMRLSNFLTRGRKVFPADCDDLESRRIQLEADWRVLEADAEALRRELGEDQWVLVFRNAGRQAMKMCESVARSVSKLRDALDEAMGQNAVAAATLKKMESYEAKKVHYGSAIDRVLTIIDRGVKDRLTVNGEILRLQADMRRRWSDLQEEIKAVDFVLETLNLADAHIQAAAMAATPISRLLIGDNSNYNTPALSRPRFESPSYGLMCTPGSSPASSAIVPTASGSITKSRQSSFNSSVTGVSTSAATTASSQSVHRRHSTVNLNGTTCRLQSVRSSVGLNRKPSKLATDSQTSSSVKSLSSAGNTPTTPKSSSRPPWSSSTNTSDLVAGYKFKNLGSPSSPSTNALNRKKSLASTKAVAASYAGAPTSKPGPQSHTISSSLKQTTISPPKSDLPRPSLPDPMSRASMGASRSSIPAPSSVLRSSLAPPTSVTPLSRPSTLNPVSSTRSRPPSSMSQMPTPSHHTSRMPSRASGTASSLSVRYGNQLPPPSVLSTRQTAQSPAPRPFLPTPSSSKPGSRVLPPASVVNGSRLPRGPSIGGKTVSPVSTYNQRMSFSASTSNAPSRLPPPSATKLPRRQSSAARLITSPPPSMSHMSKSTPSIASTPRPGITSRTMLPGRPTSVMASASRVRTSLLPQPTPSRLVSGYSAHTPGTVLTGRMSRQGHSISASMSERPCP